MRKQRERAENSGWYVMVNRPSPCYQLGCKFLPGPGQKWQHWKGHEVFLTLQIKIIKLFKKESRSHSSVCYFYETSQRRRPRASCGLRCFRRRTLERGLRAGIVMLSVECAIFSHCLLSPQCWWVSSLSLWGNVPQAHFRGHLQSSRPRSPDAFCLIAQSSMSQTQTKDGWMDGWGRRSHEPPCPYWGDPAVCDRDDSEAPLSPDSPGLCLWTQ